ncbi:hypothetical protein Efla_007142 [Eimeria flavescens]
MRPHTGLSRSQPGIFLQWKGRACSCWLLLVLFPLLVASAAMASSSRLTPSARSERLRKLLREALKSAVPCEALADAVREAGVRVIAADFDLTMINLHSGGSTSNAPGNPIFTALSADFNAFATAVNSRGIQIAVVTFGDPKAVGGRVGRICGDSLVRRVLKDSRASFEVEEVFPFYPPLYCSPTDYRALGLDAPMPHNKSYHLRRLRERFGVTKEEVLLVDDDANNCAAFAAEGGVSLLVTGEEGFNFSQLEVV